MYTFPPTNFYQEFDENLEGRDFVVSDLHGCYDEFTKFLDHLSFDMSKDRMFCCGDLVDRGPKSMQCLQLLNQHWFYSVRGNHEQMMIESLIHHKDSDFWRKNGGEWGYPVGKQDRQDIVSYVEMVEPYLPYIITVGDGTNRFNIVHAELTFAPDISDKDVDEMTFDEYRCDSMLWGRDIVQGHPAPHSENLSTTYVGHTPLNEVNKIGKQIYIDGGIVFGGKLHIVEHNAKVLHTYDKKTDSYSQTNI
ncbi:Serine/threonine-protein phosphatase 1 [compost metagenome]